MQGKYIVALDQGTTSSRTVVLDQDVNIVAVVQREFPQIYPRPGWVEHDPRQIWATQSSTLTEALELKESYPDYPVLIMGYTPDRLLHWIVEKDIIQTIWNIEQAQQLGTLAASLGKTARVHIKVDTGFHRLGKSPSDAFAAEIAAIFKVDHLGVEGIFSHLALAGLTEDEEQYRQFTDFIEKLETMGCKFRYKHIADSIACVDYPQYRMNLVRPGAL
ncbi:alanine racemase, partial [Desulfovibrio piger]|uniref:alanine racemase n=1 Tax=Desulfovibrio piger TaxID=901 RepID=UPI0026ED6A66